MITIFLIELWHESCHMMLNKSNFPKKFRRESGSTGTFIFIPKNVHTNPSDWIESTQSIWYYNLKILKFHFRIQCQSPGYRSSIRVNSNGHNEFLWNFKEVVLKLVCYIHFLLKTLFLLKYIIQVWNFTNMLQNCFIRLKYVYY